MTEYKKVKCSLCGTELLRGVRLEVYTCFDCKKARALAYAKTYPRKKKGSQQPDLVPPIIDQQPAGV